MTDMFSDPSFYEDLGKNLIVANENSGRSKAVLDKKEFQAALEMTLQNKVYVTRNQEDKQIVWDSEFLEFKNGVDATMKNYIGMGNQYPKFLKSELKKITDSLPKEAINWEKENVSPLELGSWMPIYGMVFSPRPYEVVDASQEMIQAHLERNTRLFNVGDSGFGIE